MDITNNEKLSNGVTEENKTIQTENKPSADEAMLNADQAEQVQPPAVNPPAPPAPAQDENNETESFMTKFYKKLAELRMIANQKKKEKMQKNLDNIMEYARETQKVTNNDVERITKVKHGQSSKYLKMLVKQGLLVKFGKTKNTFYKPIKQ